VWVSPLCELDTRVHEQEHCTSIAEVVGSNPVQSLNFSGLCFSNITAAFAFDISIYREEGWQHDAQRSISDEIRLLIPI